MDWPGAAYWKQLSDHYPDAKVILSVRDPDVWFDSVQSTIGPFMTGMRGHHDSELLNAAAEMCYQIIVQDIFDGKMNDRDHARATFERHVAEVIDTIPGKRLLVYRTGSGWKPLCEFLGVPEPEDPYPLTNSTREFQERIASRA